MSSQPVAHTRLNLKRAFLGITLGYVFLALLVIALGTTSFRLSETGRAHSDELSQRLLPALQTLAGLQEATLKYNLANLEYVTWRDEETQARKLTQAATHRQEIDARIRVHALRHADHLVFDVITFGTATRTYHRFDRSHAADIYQAHTVLLIIITRCFYAAREQ